MKASAIFRIIIWALVALLLIALLAWGVQGGKDGEGWFNGWEVPFIDLNFWGNTSYRYANESRYSVGEASMDIKDVIAIQVDWIDGGVTVVTGGTDQVSFSETAARQLKEEYRLRYYLEDGVLHIKYCASGARFDFGRGPNKQLTIVVPESTVLTELKVSTVSGEIDATGAQAATLRLNTTSGTVRLEQFSGQNAEVHSVSGTVRLAGVNAPDLTVESVSGETRLEQVTSDRLGVECISGSIRVTGSQVGELRCETVSGSVILEPGTTVQRIDVESVSGSVRVSLPETISGFVARYSTVSGGFDCDFPVEIPQKNKAVYNGGGIDIEVSTVSGGIRIEKVS